MEKALRPGRFRKHGRALALTIPAAYVHEMGLVPGDMAILKREPDGLRLRIIRHSTLVEIANAQDAENQLAQDVPVEEEETVAALNRTDPRRGLTSGDPDAGISR
jgi:antitoxin component of MazEF toxin-antitoxin module